MKSVMGHKFSEVPRANIPRSSFNRSCGYKTTFDSDFLIPVFVDEALPGDTFNLRMTAFSRLATPIVPIVDNMYMDSFFFAVPYRLIWDNFQKFNGEQDNPADSTDFVIPTMSAPVTVGHANGSLSDYFGLPTGIPDYEHSSLWHRAYNLIYNEWFRDENLIDSLVVDKGDGPDTSTNYVLKRRCKRHDYFTSCLPWPQKGDSVSLPLGESAPVDIVAGSGGPWFVRDTTGAAYTPGTKESINVTTGGSVEANSGTTINFDPNDMLYADLSQATAATINQLRQAFQLQRLYERDARGGSRYTEIIKSHFGVTSPDSRLQRPEYLGGGSVPVNISPVAQQSFTAATGTPQGNLAAFGVATIKNHGFVKSFTEHCLIIGLVNVRADLTYQQGLDRMFSRSTRFDFYWPALSHIGEQAVLNKEIWCQDPANVDGNGDPYNDNVFGYQERYAEYRYKPSKITGKLRSNDANSLDLWHLSQDFAALPGLNQSFIESQTPVERVVAVPSEPEFIFDSYFSLKCARPMPLYSVPGMIDHF